MKYQWFKESEEEFSFKEVEIAGDLCVLITPLISTKFTDLNKIYRSSIWRVSDGFPVSLGFRKFMNFNEQPAFEPVAPYYDKDFVLTEKLDGSCLIVSKYKGKLIVRTRGTISAYQQKNASELNPLLEQYKIELYFKSYETADFSLIFEWVTPTNQIVLKYDNPDLFLIGKVNHKDYSYATQKELNSIAHTYKFKRPRQYEYPDIKSYIDLNEKIKSWTSAEGVVVYFNNGQLLKKIKSDWYCTLHRMKSTLSSILKVAEAMYEHGYLNPETFEAEQVQKQFYEFVEKQFDYEIAEYIKPNMIEVCKKFEQFVVLPYKECQKRLKEINIYEDAHEVVQLLKTYPSLNQTLLWMIYRKTPIGFKVYNKLMNI